MNYSAIVENRASEGFTATVLGWPGFTAAGRTREEALRRLQQSFRDRLSKVEVVPLEVEIPEDTHPWMKFAGMFENDPLFDQVVEDIQTYRRELDADSAE
ncbi:MAG: type II toxin-antitoxin system HicB family antitoxin [bacterium]|nr:type II toxin-antitoxin system HicB family antitoxin [bacterium]